MSVGGNYQEIWTPRVVRYNDYSAETNAAVKDTLNQFGAFRQYSYNVSMGTTIYGTFNFQEDKKIQSIRHTLRPSISYSNRPSFEQYYDTYIIDANGNTAEYTRFEGSLFGTPSKGQSKSMGISLSNTFEAKVKDRDSTKTELKKITLLNNLNFSTSYNFLADSLRLSPIRMTTGLNLLKRKLTMNIGATFDPYKLNDNNRRINELAYARLTSANINMNYSIASSDFKRDEDDEEEEDKDRDREITSSGGRPDDLFGTANNLAQRQGNLGHEDEKPASKYPSYRTQIPWDLRMAYSLTYSNAIRQNDISNNSLMLSGNVELTPKWKVGFSSGYDFKQKGFTYTQLRFDRNLDSWIMNFSWVPFSQRASWTFFIGIKSSLLRDLKYDKTREPDRVL